MTASGAMQLMLCVLTVGASLQAAAAAGRGGRTLLQGGAAAPNTALPAFVSQVRGAPAFGLAPAKCALSGGHASSAGECTSLDV